MEKAADVISWALPCHKRHADLYKSLPLVVAAANASPPVEIVVVDYGNPKRLNLDAFSAQLQPPNTLVMPVCRLRSHFHMAHARNVSIRASSGEYVVITSCDIQPTLEFFPVVRQRIAETKAQWLRPIDPGRRQPLASAFVGVIVVQREVLLAAGGYDEQFEFYGSEDKDLQARLERRGARWADYEANPLLTMDRTENAEKVAHYRLPLTKTAMMQAGDKILKANTAAGRVDGNPHRWNWGAGWFMP